MGRRAILTPLTAVIFSFLKYGFHPTLITIGQTFPSSLLNRFFVCPKSTSRPVSPSFRGTEFSGYGAVLAGKEAISSGDKGLERASRGMCG